MMIPVYRPTEEEDRVKVWDYTKDLHEKKLKPMAVTVYAPEEDVKKWQDKADECGWPLQLYITSVINGYCRYLEEGAIEGNDFEGVEPFT